MKIFENISESIKTADEISALSFVNKAISDGIPAAVILNDGLICGMNIVGELFAKRIIFLPDVLMSAKIMKKCIEILKPYLAEENFTYKAKIVIGTVKGDLHDIGKNLIGIMLNGAGFKVIDLGNNVSSEKFVETAISEGASIIGLSALLTTTMSGMKEVINILSEKNINDIKVIIGGAPVTKNYALEIGADGYGYDAANAVQLVKNLLNLN
jgi:5-methyltetrahydrofolate--homocysteine methyltransferase